MKELPQIPGYKILEKLGQGGMADVFLGLQENLDRKVAIKILLPSLFRDDQFSIRFLKEARTAAQLNHPNIITIHDVGKAGDSYYIVMEYLEESLSDRIKREGILPPAKALDILKMIANALNYAHKKGFIHRDIKPDNIMFRSDGTAVLVDFGIARAMNATTQLTRTGMSIGTPHYMSPEQCRGDKIDGRSDIYALGVQLFELLTGKVPFSAENTTGVILKHIQEPIPHLPLKFAQFQLLIDKMLAKDRYHRYQTAAELIAVLDSITITTTDDEFSPTISLAPMIDSSLEGAPTMAAHPPTEVMPPPSPIISRNGKNKKNQLLLVLMTAIVILTAVGIFLIIEQNDSHTGNGYITQQTGEQETSPQPKTDTKTKVETKSANKTETVSKDPVIIPPDKTTDTATADTSSTDKSTTDSTDKDSSLDLPPVDDELKTQAPKNSPPKDEIKPDIVKVSPKDDLPPAKSTEEEKTPAEQTIRTVIARDIDPEIMKGYYKEIQNLKIKLPELRGIARLKVGGHVALALSIAPNGNAFIQRASLRIKLVVLPQFRKAIVEALIRKKLNSLQFEPPKDKNGKSVRMKNWNLSFKVGKYLGHINLTKQ